MDGPIFGEKDLLCAYIAGRDGMVKLRIPFGREQLDDLLGRDPFPELVVFLDQQSSPVLVMKQGRIRYVTDDHLGRNLADLLMERKNGKEGENGRDCCQE